MYASVSEIAEAERISKSYVSRVLRLALLAPDIVEAILAGTMGPAVGFEQLERGSAGELGRAAPNGAAGRYAAPRLTAFSARYLMA